MKSAMMNEQTSLHQQEIKPFQMMSKQEIVERINSIIYELEKLREMVSITVIAKPEMNLREKLFGALGKGSWAEYDKNLDWRRFDT